MQPSITLPRLVGERSLAYAARQAYILAGPERSLTKLCQQLGRPASYVRQLKRWSAAFQWQVHAQAYDQTCATLAAQQAAAQYLAEVEDHRMRYQEARQALYQVAQQLLERLQAEAETMPLQIGHLGLLLKVLIAAADLEAHALQLGPLLEQSFPEYKTYS